MYILIYNTAYLHEDFFNNTVNSLWSSGKCVSVFKFKALLTKLSNLYVPMFDTNGDITHNIFYIFIESKY